jgi:hypothetical protein
VGLIAQRSSGNRGDRVGKGTYGVDGGFAGLAVFGTAAAGLAGAAAWAARRRRPAVAVLAGGGCAVVAASAASFLYSTGPGKRALWTRLLDELDLRGDEHVLDVGCGRDRGLIGDSGWLSEPGRAVQQRVEALTDDLAAKPYQSLAPDELDELMATLEPLTTLLLAAQD